MSEWELNETSRTQSLVHSLTCLFAELQSILDKSCNLKSKISRALTGFEKETKNLTNSLSDSMKSTTSASLEQQEDLMKTRFKASSKQISKRKLIDVNSSDKKKKKKPRFDESKYEALDYAAGFSTINEQQDDDDDDEDPVFPPLPSLAQFHSSRISKILKQNCGEVTSKVK